MIDLDAIKARCRALDERMGEGPWTLEDSRRYYGLSSVYDGNGNVVSHGVEEEQAFISHSRADVPALVAEVERLRRELHDEQVRRDEWEKMYNRAICWNRGGDVMKLVFGWCEQCTKFADCYPQDEGCYPGPYLLTPSCGQQSALEPAPDARPGSHPREETE